MADRIRIITTGGTIDKVYFDALSEYQVGEPAIAQILEEANVALKYEVQQICRKDSLDLTDADRDAIHEAVARSPERRILITHGTDTMIQTAQRLSSIQDAVIVFTGSMAPAKLRNSDAFFNAGCAIIAVQTLPPGTYIVMNGRIVDPSKAVKNRNKLRFEET
ncbi:asparaginase domain-containing protein [Oligoflexus tunisiensis]|uniref:asparaginase domain-containing protein n=1 Tax=Oligoflexus tunisiensis TaxID=708132 RepID=UPI000A4B75BC|nr:asparaginase domain-containing protein [Oligoflexus tunisiensis]